MHFSLLFSYGFYKSNARMWNLEILMRNAVAFYRRHFCTLKYLMDASVSSHPFFCFVYCHSFILLFCDIFFLSLPKSPCVCMFSIFYHSSSFSLFICAVAVVVDFRRFVWKLIRSTGKISSKSAYRNWFSKFHTYLDVWR